MMLDADACIENRGAIVGLKLLAIILIMQICFSIISELFTTTLTANCFSARQLALWLEILQVHECHQVRVLDLFHCEPVGVWSHHLLSARGRCRATSQGKPPH